MMEEISGLGQFSGLNALSGLRGLKQKKLLADMKFCGLLDLSIVSFSRAKSELAISGFHLINF